MGGFLNSYDIPGALQALGEGIPVIFLETVDVPSKDMQLIDMLTGGSKPGRAYWIESLLAMPLLGIGLCDRDHLIYDLRRGDRCDLRKGVLVHL